MIGWQADLDHEEYPPDWMCPFDDLLIDHFDWVIQRRKNKYSGGSDDSDEDMVENEWGR